MGEQECFGCGESKPLTTEFWHKSRQVRGEQQFHARCKLCRKAYNKTLDVEQSRRVQRENKLLRRHGITSKVYDSLVEKQRGCCAICGIHVSELTGKPILMIDHDHKTGKIRGLLCYHCNFAVGLFKDNIDYLKQAIIYLGTHNDRDTRAIH